MGSGGRLAHVRGNVSDHVRCYMGVYMVAKVGGYVDLHVPPGLGLHAGG